MVRVPIPTGLLLAFFLTAVHTSAQPKRLRDLERRFDAVVLVADVRTGALAATARLGEARERRYFPGSLFKLAIAVAALRSGGFDRSTTYTCTGKDTIGGTERLCWNHSGHATIGFSRALALSCNLYFRHVARSLSMHEIAQAARSIGMAPDPSDDQTPMEKLNEETLLGSAFPVSPTQMLITAIALATRGRRSPGHGDLFGATYKPLYEGLSACIRSGTGQGAWTARFSMGGKTGTAEVPGHPHVTIGWFVGFAPFDNPRYAVVVMYRRARGFEAAGIARMALETLM